jgi:RNA polymerase sigma factor (TIGR02999 family)
VNEVTRLLSAIDQGDPQATEQLLPLVYDELRKLATQKLGRETPGQMLQPTALVHEVFLRLVGDDATQQWETRGHFFAAAAEAMRRILVESARRRQSLKGGALFSREPLDDIAIPEPEFSADLLALDESLEKLAGHDATAAQLVKLRYFSGLTVAQAAAAMQISPRSADRLWVYAKAWLYRDLEGAP